MALMHCAAVTRCCGETVCPSSRQYPPQGTGPGWRCWWRVARPPQSRDSVAVRVENAANFAEAIVRKEQKETVLDDRAADRPAELVLLMNRLGQQEWRAAVMQRLKFAVGVKCVQSG